MTTATIEFSPQQTEAIKAASEWFAGDTKAKQVFRLFGYAGTGKTTLAKHLAKDVKGAVCYAAFTGKAALMMRRNGCAGASTIHSLIYRVEEVTKGGVTFTINRESDAVDAALIVIDECSMVDEVIARDLLSFGVPVLVLGDPAQLPPVKGAGFFTEATPDHMLTEIHRQAAGNPIIKLATLVREGGALEVGRYGESRVVTRGTLHRDQILDADQILVGRNVTRHSFNARIRKMMGRASVAPVVGDRLVCLRNDRKMGLFNGGIFEVAEVIKRRGKKNADLFNLMVSSVDFPNRKPIRVKVRREYFEGGVEELDWRDLRDTQHFDYGYALTVHKSQGSQWDNVIAYDESAVFREDWRRWLYTAITRASERVTIVL